MKFLMIDLMLLSGILITINILAMVKLGYHFISPYIYEYKRRKRIEEALNDAITQAEINGYKTHA